MSKLDKNVLVTGLLNTLENQEPCIGIRKTILDDESKISDDEYEIASQVFNAASEAYFKLGFEACRALMLDSVIIQ